jgi:hypothetical protein
MYNAEHERLDLDLDDRGSYRVSDSPGQDSLSFGSCGGLSRCKFGPLIFEGGLKCQ